MSTARKLGNTMRHTNLLDSLVHQIVNMSVIFNLCLSKLLNVEMVLSRRKSRKLLKRRSKKLLKRKLMNLKVENRAKILLQYLRMEKSNLRTLMILQNLLKAMRLRLAII